MELVRLIPYEDILTIRQKVLWPNKSIDYVKMPFDKSDNIKHLGIIKDKVVLVTGAGGSIGSVLSKQVLANKPKLLIIIDNSEGGSPYPMEFQKIEPTA